MAGPQRVRPSTVVKRTLRPQLFVAARLLSVSADRGPRHRGAL